VRYKLLVPCELKLKTGKLLTEPGQEFEGEDVHSTVNVGHLVDANVVAPVEPAKKVSKELITENAPRSRGRKPRGA
jgi:hypothetical protein